MTWSVYPLNSYKTVDTRSRIPFLEKSIVLPILLCYLFGIVVLASYSGASSAAHIIDVNEGEKIFITKSAHYVYSTPSIKDEKQILEQFKLESLRKQGSATKKVLAIEQHANIWFKQNIRNPSSQNLDLFFVGGDATMPWLQISIIKNGTTVLRKTGGIDVHLNDRSVHHRLFLVPFTLRPGETVTVIAGMSNHSRFQNTWIESQTSFWANEDLTTLTDGIFLGTILLIGLMSSLLYITDRDKIYLYIYVIIIGNAIYHFSSNGYAQLYLWPTTPGISDDWAATTLNLSIIGGILFSMRFLNLRKQQQRWPHAISTAYLVFSVGIIPANFLIIENITQPLITTLGNIATVYFALIWIHSAIRSCNGDIKARTYAIVWLFYLVPYLTPILLTYHDMRNEISTLLISRNGDVFLAIALWAALLLDIRKTHLEKNAAIVESKAKSAFLATMSHELRTPLNGVIGMGELLHKTEQTPLQRHYSDVIVSSATAIAQNDNKVPPIHNNTLITLPFSDRSLII